MNKQTHPSLFGLAYSNRDFTEKEAWGKNQFNSSFPAALCCYMHSKDIKANYIAINNAILGHSEISIEKVFGIHPLDENIFFAFESQYTPYQKYTIGPIPRTDLVIQKKVLENAYQD